MKRLLLLIVALGLFTPNAHESNTYQLEGLDAQRLHDQLQQFNDQQEKLTQRFNRLHILIEQQFDALIQVNNKLLIAMQTSTEQRKAELPSRCYLSNPESELLDFGENRIQATTKILKQCEQLFKNNARKREDYCHFDAVSCELIK